MVAALSLPSHDHLSQAQLTMLLRTFGGGPRLSESDLRAFELEYRLVLPAPYRRFLAETNGGRPERDVLELTAETRVRVRYFFGLESIVAPCNLGWLRRVLASRLPEDFLAIATTDRADKICLSLRGGHVVHWDGGTAETTIVASAFEAFAAMLRRDACSPTPTSSIWATTTRG